jgi:transposase InsO family protein
MAMEYVANLLICVIWCSQGVVNDQLLAGVLQKLPFQFWILFFARLFTFLNLHGIRTTARVNEVLAIVMGAVVVVFFIAAAKYLLAHERRRILHFGVTAHPTAEWTAQQLREAFPWDRAPRFLLRDRYRIFGTGYTKQVEEFGMQETLGAPGVPQQRADIERVIGTIRRECLDHVIVFNETRSAGNPLATCHVAGAGNQLTVRIVRHSQRKRATDRPDLRSNGASLRPYHTSRRTVRWICQEHFTENLAESARQTILNADCKCL